MPFVEVTTREPISQEVKAKLARNLSDKICELEIGGVTDGSRPIDWMWFRVLTENDWAVGGEFGQQYLGKRTMCLAHIITPEAFMNHQLQLKAIAEVTSILREGLNADQDDDGSGMSVIFTEIPRGKWGNAGKPTDLFNLIDIMQGKVSSERRAEMHARFDGYDKMKDSFGIPR